MKSHQKSFTVLELLITATIVLVFFVWFFLINTVFRGNYWFTETGVLREMRLENPQASEVLKTTRNIYSDSIIYVKIGDQIARYCLDSSIAFNYDLKHCPAD